MNRTLAILALTMICGYALSGSALLADTLPDHIIFRSAQTVSSGLGGLAAMDARCQAKAEAAGLDGTWLAILSDSSADAKDRLATGGADGPFFNTYAQGAQQAASDLDDLFDGDLTATLYFNEFGTTEQSDSSTWTATLADGTYAGSSYGDWTSFAGSARVGRQLSTDSQWLDWFEQSGVKSANLYCARSARNPLFTPPPPPDFVHTVFVSSTSFDGNFGGLSGADAQCQQLADAAGIGDRPWRAILSDSTTHARDRLTISGPVFNTAGDFVADDFEDLFDGGNAAFVRFDENGVLRNDQQVWTGSHPDGRHYSANGASAYKQDWTSSFGATMLGGSTKMRAAWLTWTTSFPSGSSFPARIYCIDQVPDIGLCRIDPPEPENRALLAIDPDVLPAGARAHLPAFDGDPFVVTFAPSAEKAQKGVAGIQVLADLIEPILTAVGFERDIEELSSPPNNGLEMPTAEFDALARAVAGEYLKIPGLLRPKTLRMIDVFLGLTPPDAEINQALETGEGMDFDQFVAGIERVDIQFPFQQVVLPDSPPIPQAGLPMKSPNKIAPSVAVPIEHTLLVASAWEGHEVRAVQGALLNDYQIANDVTIAESAAASTAQVALSAVSCVDMVTSSTPEDGVHLVLLPYGTESTGTWQLRFAYRMILQGTSLGQEGPFLLWLDAESGEILKLEPLFDNSTPAEGEVFNRDPGIGSTTASFSVNDASGGEYTLQLAGVMKRVDYLDNDFDALDVSIPDSGGGSSSTFANFDQTPINDAAEALCDSGSNKAYQQVNFFGNISQYYQQTLGLGIFTPFPTSPWNPRVESGSAGCNAWSSMNYGACEGYFNNACPDFSDGTFNLQSNAMNFAHDNTMVAHELAHNVTPRFTSTRPNDWCGNSTCSKPVGWGVFHDLADFWADHFESTNCTAGWVAKNSGGTDHSLNCDHHSEGGSLPRLHEVTVPFNEGSPGDHFPEHRTLATSGYADGQIAAAALWQVRVGMRSKCRPSGLPQFGVRFARALRNTGFFSASGSGDQRIFRYLYDLENQMLDQWATSGTPDGPPAFKHNGAHTANKVTAGFAKTGIFLIPYQCLDGDPATTEPTVCPSGENGGDAVVDIDDNDLADDLQLNGVEHLEVDFLELGGPAPTFQVWTGPRYRVDGSGGSSSLDDPAPCNVKFRLEVATAADFPPSSTIQSPWIDVDTDPTTPDPSAGPWDCYGTWTPTASQWISLQSGGADTRIYYRARTRDAADGNERISTEPGAGLYSVPPPYAVITTDGRSDY